MKIAVIGAGIFGIISALKLKESGHNVTIFESNSDILQGASRCNQYRLHRGYHYPRSNEMIQSTDEFESEFKDCILKNGYERYYAISSQDSRTNKDQYLSFLEENRLKYRVIDRLDIVKEDSVDLIVKVSENSFDYEKLYLTLRERLNEARIEVRLNRYFTSHLIEEFDIVVNCTYSNLNYLLPESEQIEYQFELVEKCIVSLGKEWQRKSVVILDGDFCCIDPYGFDGYYHLIGHVKEAIHDRQIGKDYHIPFAFQSVVNCGYSNPSFSKFNQIFEGTQEFFNYRSIPVSPPKRIKPSLLNNNIHHFGSMFTVRTVLPNRDHDDARPSIITKHSEKLYSIFSGKIGTSVSIANQYLSMIN